MYAKIMNLNELTLNFGANQRYQNKAGIRSHKICNDLVKPQIEVLRTRILIMESVILKRTTP